MLTPEETQISASGQPLVAIHLTDTSVVTEFEAFTQQQSYRHPDCPEIQLKMHKHPQKSKKNTIL